MENKSLAEYFEKEVSALLPGFKTSASKQLVVDCFGDYETARKWFSDRNCTTVDDWHGNGLIHFMKNRNGS